MWHYRSALCPTTVIRHRLQLSTLEKYAQSASALSQTASTTSEQPRSDTAAQWYLHRSTLSSIPVKSTGEVVRELKSFDEFGLLSRNGLSSWTPIPTSENTFTDHLLRDSSVVDFSAIPTIADPSELGGCVESAELEQLEELLDHGYDVSAVLNSMTATEDSSASLSPASSSANDTCGLEDVGSRSGIRRVLTESHRQHTKNASLLASSVISSSVHECPPSPSKSFGLPRFDPDVQRVARATVTEVVKAVNDRDLASLRDILMEKQWPDHRSIGRHLDKLFELVVQDSQDIDEAMLFFRDFAASNRRAYLHDENGIRLACRSVCDSGSIDAAVESLKIFRNMFLVRSPNDSIASAKNLLLDQLYTASSLIGSVEELERLHCFMVDLGFDETANIFIRALTRSMLTTKGDITQVFERWLRLSSGHGTTHACELIWEGLLGLVEDPKKQAGLARRLLSHCLQYDHPSAIVANFIATLVRTGHLDSARVVFLKVSVPGKFLKKSLQDFAHQLTLQNIEDFATLVSDCMFAEKRRGKTFAAQSSVLSPDLVMVLDSFCGTTKRLQSKFASRNEKKKLHRVNDVQLYELSEFLQTLWLREAEKCGDSQAVDRMVAWSTANRLQFTAKMVKQIADIKSRNTSTSTSHLKI